MCVIWSVDLHCAVEGTLYARVQYSKNNDMNINHTARYLPST